MNFSIEVPAGTYWLGDPCYFVPRDDWDVLMNDSDCFNKPSGTVRGFTVYAAGTMHGDGAYLASDGCTYPVDSGLIGLTPVELAYANSNLGTMVTFNEPFLFGCEGGTILAGGIQIWTDPEDEYNE